MAIIYIIKETSVVYSQHAYFTIYSSVVLNGYFIFHINSKCPNKIRICMLFLSGSHNKKNIGFGSNPITPWLISMTYQIQKYKTNDM